MREIKFRAWDQKAQGFVNTADVFINLEGCVCAQSEDDGTVCAFSDQSALMLEQFTGLHDKNGKEVYEGDIDEARGICVWIEEDCRWAFQEVETGYQYGLFAIAGDFSIIGNIHENPELLEASC